MFRLRGRVWHNRHILIHRMPRESLKALIVVIATTLAISACGALHETRRQLALATSDNSSMSAAPPGIAKTAWRWRGTIYRGAGRSAPEDPARYRVVLQPDGRVEVQADCNTVEGRYAMVRGRLGIRIEPAARVTCKPGSLGAEFLEDLGAASTWSMRGGDLYVRGAAARMRFSQ